MRFAAWRGKMNASICVVMASLALLSFVNGARGPSVRLGHALAAGSATIGLLTLVQYVFQVDLAIDQFVAQDPWFEESARFPNRMGPTTALAFTLTGTSLLLSHKRRRRYVLAQQALALAVLTICGLALAGYLYEVSFLYKPTGFIRMSPYMAAANAFVCLGVLGLRTDVGIPRTVASPGIGGYLARRLLVLTVVIPIGLSWSLLVGRELGWYSESAASALSAVAIVLVLAAVVLFLARSLNHVDDRRLQSEQYLRDANELTSALARASTLDEVVSVTMELGLSALGATAGAVVRLSPDERSVRIIRARGYEDEALKAYQLIPIETPVAVTDAVRMRRPVFVGSPEEYRERYPNVPQKHLRRQHASWAALPLEGQGRLLGAITLSFDHSQTFDAESRERLSRLAWQCAQALDRALLVESEREARERARAALEAAAIGTYIYDVDAGVIEHDAGVKRIFEFKSDEGSDPADYEQRVHPDDRSRFRQNLERSVAEGLDLETRYRVLPPSGAVRWVLDKGRMTRDATGKLRYLAGAVVDFSSEERAREQAEAANRAKDEFLAMLGHELRNPLSPIVTSLQLMKLRAPSQFERERAVIERQVQHMIRLVDDLLDVSRITRGKIELRKVPVELYEVVSHALEVSSPLLESRRHQVDVSVPTRGLLVDGDPERLAQVVSNLLTNAAKYTEPGGQIRLEAERREETIVLSVSDTGMGIPPELLKKIFDLFVQSERTIERAQGGLGLGLSLVRSLVEHHGGTVSAESDGPGKGSRFTITLPVAPGLAEPVIVTTPSMRSAVRSRPKRILVVDDNRDAAETLAEALSTAGHRVRMAFDGPAALVVAQEFQPNVAFLDIGLPAMDGYELAHKLRALPWEVQPLLIAVTGYGQPSDRQRASEAGFDTHLVKPVTIETALDIVQGSAAPPSVARQS